MDSTSARVQLPVPFARPANSHMSSTVTATTSPPAARTNTFTPTSRYSLDGTTAWEDSSAEPPAKKLRLGNAPRWADNDVFQECLQEQVFPHVDKHVQSLQADWARSPAEARLIGTKIIGILTGLEFTREYRKGNGRISPEYEAQLAAQVPIVLQALVAELEPKQRIKPESLQLPAAPATVQLSVETPVPIPSARLPIPPRPPRPDLSRVKSYEPKISTSPIPIPKYGEVRSTKTRFATGLSAHTAPPISLAPARITSEPQVNDKPYLASKSRIFALNSAQEFFPFSTAELGSVQMRIHVDFSSQELGQLRTVVWDILGITKKSKDVKRDLKKVLKGLRKRRAEYLKLVESCDGRLPGRNRTAIENVFEDLIYKEDNDKPTILTLQLDEQNKQGSFLRESRTSALLLARQIVGPRGFSTRRPQSFANELRKSLEDEMELRAQWMGCAGDIVTIAWVSNDSFICGTTEHSDAHNQQYNKPGNLVLGSCNLGTLRAYPQHRIVRPIIEKGENATESMRQSQDYWLYSSVATSDYDSAHDRAYTAGYDRCVKIWKVESSGASMELVGEWAHDGNVNFVAASRHESGMVATAADVAANAVRIYSVDANDLSSSQYRSFSCSRVTDGEGNTVSTENWAYFPATMQWGVSPEVRHLLLVGYSPRSRTGDDSDIPVERRDSGELCLWNGLTGERWRILSGKNSNVFEVLWHPTQPSFIAATSPAGLEIDPGTRTQIRVFTPAPAAEGTNAFSNIKILDCTALDINELTIMPNSYTYSYITAACTDGNVYVWDTARSDKPIHVLRHGEPIDECDGDRERDDVGVKFTAWGTTPDRFYTGSSDGMVKVWNVRSVSKPLVRNLMEAPAPITCGMFSPDKKNLVVGDASGRVFMLSVDKDEDRDGDGKKQKGSIPFSLNARRPKLIIHHPEPAPPTHDAEGKPIIIETGSSRAWAYLASGQLVKHPNPTIGAVKGPAYAETGLYLREAHLDLEPDAPLLAGYEKAQQETRDSFPGSPRKRFLLKRPVRQPENFEEQHANNLSVDLDLDALPESTKRALRLDGVDLELMSENVLPYEEVPDVKGFGDNDDDSMEIVELDSD
ncbi:WD40-repeat-containing domain protein [Cladorrhinum sp. PSN332]|nr:WD40-repeat-containing domain protein [Cladorrhinum sp. PSN332]